MLSQINIGQSHAHQKYLETIGSQLLSSLKKIESQFKSSINCSKDLSFEFLFSKMKPILDSYQVIALEMSDTCYAIDATDFGDSITFMFSQFSSFLKLTLSLMIENSSTVKFNKISKEKAQKFKQTFEGNNFRKREINSFYLNEFLKQTKQLTKDDNESFAQTNVYENLKQSKEKALKINSSKANYILSDTITSFEKKAQYLDKFINIRENYTEIIRYDNKAIEQIKLSNELNEKLTLAVQKLKKLFIKFADGHHFLKTEELVQVKEKLKKTMKRTQRREKSYYVLEAKVKKLKEEISQQDSQIVLLQDLLEKKEKQKQKIILFQEEQINELNSSYIKKINKKMEQVIKVDAETSCNLNDEVTMKKKRSNTRKMSIVKANKLRLTSKIIHSIVSEGEEKNFSRIQKINVKIDGMNEPRALMRMKRSKRNSYKTNDHIQQAKKAKNMRSQFKNKISTERLQLGITQVRKDWTENIPENQSNKKGFFPNFCESQVNIEGLKDEVKLTHFPISNFQASQKLMLCLFFDLQNAKNIEYYKLSLQMKKEKKIKRFSKIIKENFTSRTKDDFWSSEKQGRKDMVFYYFKEVWKALNAIKAKNNSVFRKISLFIRYPYSLVMRSKEKGWIENVKFQTEIGKGEVLNFIEKLVSIHKGCEKLKQFKNTNISFMCCHLLQFFSSLGLKTVIEDQT